MHSIPDSQLGIIPYSEPSNYVGVVPPTFWPEREGSSLNWEADDRLRKVEKEGENTNTIITGLQNEITALQALINRRNQWAFTNSCTWTYPANTNLTATWNPALTNPVPVLDAATTSNVVLGSAGGNNTFGPKVNIEGWYFCSYYYAITNLTATAIVIKTYLTGWYGRYYKDTVLQPSTQTFETLQGLIWMGQAQPPTSTNDYFVPSFRITVPAGSVTNTTIQQLIARLNLVRPMTFNEASVAIGP